jgi:hypothetical protein
LKHCIRLASLLLLVAGLSGSPCAADEPAGTGIERFNLSTGGTGLYRPGKWGLIKVSLANPQDRDVELLATTHLLDDPTLQYGRRLWMPPKSRLSTWHPLLMPPLDEPGQKFFDLRSMVLVESGGADAMATNEFGSMQFDQGFRVAHDEQSTAVIVGRGEPDSGGYEWTTPQDVVTTARLSRGLFHNVTLLGDPLVPAGEELLDSLDHLVIASDRILPDAAGIAAIRRWVASGGRLWIMADRVSNGLLAALLGDDDTVTEVDRVDLTSVSIDMGSWSVVGSQFERDLERPARFVRVIVENMEVEFFVNGWPAAFRKPHGDGKILVTTLGGDGWVSPRTSSDPVAPGGKDFQTPFVPSSPLSQMALEFFTPRPPPPIPRELAEEQVRQMIGYAVPQRSLVLGTLMAFTGLMLVIAVWLGRRGRLELMALVIPGLAVTASVVLLGAGWNNRSTIPASTAIVQWVQAVPGTDDIRSSGLAGLFENESPMRQLSGSQGGWMTPEMAGLEGTTRRLVWSDIDDWRWENLSSKPGLRMVAFQTAGHMDKAVEAVAEFSSNGVTGKLALPAGVIPEDVVIATSRGRMGVGIQADGSLTAASDAVLGADQYMSASVLSDEQQRRSRMLSQVLAPVPGANRSPLPVLFVWTKPWDLGTSLVRGSDTVGSALVSVPLRWQRPAAGSSISIPSPFLPVREVPGPDGLRPTGLYDVRTEKWAEKSGAATSWLAFTVPGHLLPLDVKSARVTIKVLGPLGRLELSAWGGERLHSLKVWETPVGTLTHDISDPQALKLDPRGRLLIRVDVGRPKNSSDPAKSPPVSLKAGIQEPVSYWQIEDLLVQLRADIPPATASQQPQQQQK